MIQCVIFWIYGAQHTYISGSNITQIVKHWHTAVVVSLREISYKTRVQFISHCRIRLYWVKPPRYVFIWRLSALRDTFGDPPTPPRTDQWGPSCCGLDSQWHKARDKTKWHTGKVLCMLWQYRYNQYPVKCTAYHGSIRVFQDPPTTTTRPPSALVQCWEYSRHFTSASWG